MASAVRVGIVGDLGGSKSTHTATDEALAWLAGDYLRAFGPAPCGLPVVGRGAGGTSLGCALHGRDRRAGRRATCCLPATLKAIEAAEATGPDAVYLLPKWDCYPLGYASDGRQRLVQPDTQERVYTLAGTPSAWCW